MKRRDLVAALGGALLLPASLQPRAQQPDRPRRVGVLAPSTRAREEVTLRPFFDGMRELGWIEGRNMTYHRAYADDQRERLSTLAAELVASGPDVIHAGSGVAAFAAAKATRSIPIVMGSVSDRFALTIVQSLARPGGNVTGVASATELGSKRVEILKEMLPPRRRVGMLIDRTTPPSLDEKYAREAAQKLGLAIVDGEVSGPAQIEPAMATLVNARADVVVVIQSALLHNMRKSLIDSAARAKLPVVASRGEFADDGAIVSYGSSLAQHLRRSAAYVDKILKGARPADLPIELPTTFELVLNLKAARALGITFPQSLLFRADRVIE